ncbi:hypothetical protein BBM34_10630 [Vibrio parahaemolyticus]|nr:hypothetical protein BBM34_10630 [Vibrio parahaemolyticus]OXD09035.1 hypothetical protein CA166_11060 [Vibrio parahaemolyticus]TOE94454.1 hypothetical protein CGJ32_02875 [Vibrio parahaemolyticus]TOI14003.1 hypothetical protein CGI67_02830 [Vibrio parahaemolyticus]
MFSSPENQSGHRVEPSGKKEKQKPRSPKTLPAGTNCWLFWFLEGLQAPNPTRRFKAPNPPNLSMHQDPKTSTLKILKSPLPQLNLRF